MIPPHFCGVADFSFFPALICDRVAGVLWSVGRVCPEMEQERKMSTTCGEERARWLRCLAAVLLLLTAATAQEHTKPQPAAWAPPDIDQVSAPAGAGTGCDLEEVLGRASGRVQVLVSNMQRFSANEEIEFSEVDRQGVLRPSHKAAFSYVAYIHDGLPHQLQVEEYR